MRRDPVEKPPVVADDDGAAGEVEDRLFERPQRIDVEIVRRLVEQQDVAAALEHPRHVHAVALASGEVAHQLLLIGPLEVEPRHVRAAGNLAFPERDDVLSFRDRLPDVVVAVENVAALIDVGQDNRLADAQGSAVGLLLTDDHAEERRLPRAVGPDHADDAARRQAEREVLHQQVVAVPFANALCLHDELAQARPGWEVELLQLLRAPLPVLAEKVFVRRDARLALGVARTGRHAHPLELVLQRLLACGAGLFFLGEAARFLIEPRGVVPLPGNPRAAIELQDPARDVVEEVAVVRDRHDGARVLLQVPLEPRDRLRVQVVCRLVEQQEIGFLEEQPAQRHAAPFAAGERGHVGVASRTAQRVHRDLEVRVEVPQVLVVDLVLEPGRFVRDLVRVVLHQRVVAVDDRFLLRDAFLDVPEHRLRRVELGLLCEEPHRRVLGRERLPRELIVLARHHAEQGRLAGAVVAEHADLRAVIERQPDPLQDLPLRRDGLAKILHREDEFGHGSALSLLGSTGRIGEVSTRQGTGGKGSVPF